MKKFTLALLGSAALVAFPMAAMAQPQPAEQAVESDPSKSLGDSDRQQAEGAEGTAVQQGDAPAGGAGSAQAPAGSDSSPAGEQAVESDPSKSLGDSDRQQAEGADNTAVQQGDKPAEGAGSVQQPGGDNATPAEAGEPADQLGEEGRASSGGGADASE
jgi:hypothetical protein